MGIAEMKPCSPAGSIDFRVVRAIDPPNDELGAGGGNGGAPSSGEPQAFFSSKAVADELVLLCLKSMIVADPALLAQLEAGEIEEVH